MTSRRGYSDASMNTNELLWNAQIAQSFLKNRAATISVQFYDILQQQSNISRTLSATLFCVISTPLCYCLVKAAVTCGVFPVSLSSSKAV